MPPKPKFTKDQMIAAALDIVSEKGLSALTARSLGAETRRLVETYIHPLSQHG